jgi:hypothetical protein
LSSKDSSVSVAKGEIINDDLFIAAQTANIEGTVNGDVFIGAQTVKVNGVVNGNLYVGANAFYLGGAVKGSVYAGAQSVLVNGATIDDSLLVGAATVDIDKTSTVGGSVFAGAASLNIDSAVGRNVFAGVGNLILGGDSKVGKDLYYAASQNAGQVNISPDAKIAGSIHKSEVKAPETNVNAAGKNAAAVLGKFKTAATIVSFISALIVGLIYLKFFGGNYGKAVELLTKSFWKTFGVGFLVTVAFVPALIIILITVIGIPIAGLAVLFLLIFVYLAKIVVGGCLGNWLTERFNWKLSAYWAFALGLLAIFVLKLLPVIGFFTGLVVLWVGVGSLVLALFDRK